MYERETPRLLEELSEKLALKKATGELLWRNKVSQRLAAGSVAGTKRPDGFYQIGYRGRYYRVDRIVFAMTRGAWPTGRVGHIDGDRANCKPENLVEL